jgi:hypothetical protein
MAFLAIFSICRARFVTSISRNSSTDTITPGNVHKDILKGLLAIILFGFRPVELLHESFNGIPKDAEYRQKNGDDDTQYHS